MNIEQMPYLIQPWKHQLRAIASATSHPDYAFLMDMGTGKTGATINVLRFHYTKHGRILRTLILCPIAVVPNWKREFKAHSKIDQKKIILLIGSEKERCKLLDSCKGDEILITNYECMQMKGVVQRLLRWAPEVCIADESQRIKNPKAVRTKVATAIADQCRHRYILTGTPILNNAMDVFAQYRFLDGGQTFGTNFYQFRNHFFVDKNAGMPAQRYFPDWRPRPGVYEEFNRLIYRKAIRVMKSECLDLPPFVRQRLEVAMTAQQRQNYEQMEKQLIAYLNSQACVAQLAITKSLRLAQICSGFFRPEETDAAISYGKTPRLEALSELLEDLTPQHKVIVWACFHENYAAIEALLRDLKIPGVKLVGGISDKERQRAIDAFQNDESVRVMVANQAAGGVGVNLTAASYAVYYSRNFSLEADLQSEARNYRGGSEIHESVTRIDLVCPGTIDEKILDALARKENIANDILKLRKLFAP